MTATITTRWVDVCAASILESGRGVTALVDDDEVAIFMLPTGVVHAIDDHDPISRTSVLSRGIVGSIGDAVVVASPMYKHHIDLTTGVCIEQPDVSVRTWPVHVVDGRVLIGTTAP